MTISKLTVLIVQLGLIMSSFKPLRFKLGGRTDFSCELWWFDAFKEQIWSREEDSPPIWHYITYISWHYNVIFNNWLMLNKVSCMYLYIAWYFSTVDMRILILHVLALAVWYCIFHFIQQIHHNLEVLSQY